MNITGVQYGRAMARYRRAGPWELEGVSDCFEGQEDRAMTECELCGTSIRYVHCVSNAKLGEELEVGCCCAERLCCSKRPREAEEEFKARAKKHATILRQREAFYDDFPERWRETMKGNFKRTIHGRLVVIFKDRFGRGFCVCIAGEFQPFYSTPDEALVEAAKIIYPMPDEG